MMFTRKGEAVDWTIFLKSFAFEAWIGIVISHGIFFVFIGSIVHRANRTGFESDFNLKSLVAHLFCSQLCIGSPQEPHQLTNRLMFLIISLSGYFIFTLYTGYIGAFLAIPIFKPPVNNLEGILDSEYSLAVSKGSSVERYFTGSKNDSIQSLLLKNKKITFINREIEFAQRLMEGK